MSCILDTCIVRHESRSSLVCFSRHRLIKSCLLLAHLCLDVCFPSGADSTVQTSLFDLWTSSLNGTFQVEWPHGPAGIVGVVVVLVVPTQLPFCAASSLKTLPCLCYFIFFPTPKLYLNNFWLLIHSRRTKCEIITRTCCKKKFGQSQGSGDSGSTATGVSWCCLRISVEHTNEVFLAVPNIVIIHLEKYPEKIGHCFARSEGSVPSKAADGQMTLLKWERKPATFTKSASELLSCVSSRK